MFTRKIKRYDHLTPTFTFSQDIGTSSLQLFRQN